jgi:preprotein translocase subunit SecF
VAIRLLPCSHGHDVLVTMAFIKLMQIEVSLTVVAAILTLFGYSGNDTIIIFDRVRENLKKARKDRCTTRLIGRSTRRCPGRC